MADFASLRDRFLVRLEPAMERVEGVWSRMSARDRRAALGMTLAILVAVFYLGITTMARSLRTLEATVASREKELKAAQSTEQELETSRRRVIQMEQELRAQGDFSLAGFLEQGDLSISRINDAGTVEGEFFLEQKSEVAVKGVTLQQTVELLHRLQIAPRHLLITNLKVKTNLRNREQLDVDLDVTVYSPKAKEAEAPLPPPPPPSAGDKQG